MKYLGNALFKMTIGIIFSFSLVEINKIYFFLDKNYEENLSNNYNETELNKNTIFVYM